MRKEILEEEQRTLDQKLNEIDNIVKSLSEELKNNSSKDVILEKTNRKFINKYLAARRNPYFAWIDTYEDGKQETFYIGYTAIAKDKHEDVVYSWKSSIGDLFYSFNGGDGEVIVERENGDKFHFKVLFKRTLEIEKLKVRKYSDVVSEIAIKQNNTNTNGILYDDFLIELLNNTNNETQLKDIIMTIQKEQNESNRKIVPTY